MINRCADGAVAVVVCVVIVCIASDFASDGMISVPIVWVIAIPVIADMPVMAGPVAAQAYEDVLAMIVRVNVSERKP